MDLKILLQISARDHSHLCPRQILGVRLGLAGMNALGFEEPPGEKQLIVITETDGCFVDGLSAATKCTVGHRTLRVEDNGKAAAIFADARSGRTIRVAPKPEIRHLACIYAPEESQSYMAQMQAYQVMPENEMFSFMEVRLKTSLESLISRPGLRVNCAECGEEIMNEREVYKDGHPLCRSCAGDSFYTQGNISPTK